MPEKIQTGVWISHHKIEIPKGRKVTSDQRGKEAGTKAIVCIGVNTEDQVKEGVSLDNQRANIMAYSDLKDLVRVCEFGCVGAESA